MEFKFQASGLQGFVSEGLRCLGLLRAECFWVRDCWGVRVYILGLRVKGLGDQGVSEFWVLARRVFGRCFMGQSRARKETQKP